MDNNPEKSAKCCFQSCGRSQRPAQQKNDYVDTLEAAFIDALDGSSKWHEIQANTGLSEVRCKEIEALFNEVSQKYNKRHGI
jgi:hypothetical protein